MANLMGQRDKLFRKFGPLIIEAIALTILETIKNTTGPTAQKPPTDDQIIEAIEKKLSTLEPYDWMQP